jgi:hypothetical protein
MESMIRDSNRRSRREILGVGVSAVTALSTVGLTGCAERRT